jgi:hypothetical protein
MLGVFALIFLVVLQGYWVVGSYLIESVPLLSEDETKRDEGIKQEARWVVNQNKHNNTESVRGS